MSGKENTAARRARPAGNSIPRKLSADFFVRTAAEVAHDLLGTILIRRQGRRLLRARIVEVEAYLGPRDLASHASKGRTKRTEVLFGPSGRAYVYFVYGMHWMLNVVAGVEGDAHAVLIRAADPLDGWEADLTGPGKLARGFQITGADNGLDVTGDRTYFLLDPDYRAKPLKSKRIGIDYANHWQTRLLRFVDAANPIARKLRR